MSEMRAQYLIYSVLIHNSSIETCACIQNHLKKYQINSYCTINTILCVKTLFHLYLKMKLFINLTKKKSG